MNIDNSNLAKVLVIWASKDWMIRYVFSDNSVHNETAETLDDCYRKLKALGITQLSVLTV